MKILITSFFFLCLSPLSFSQTYDIQAFSKGGNTIAVQVRLTSGTPLTTADYVTDIKFGIKWLHSYGVDLNAVSGNYNIAKSGTRTTNGIYDFQAFGVPNSGYKLPSNWDLNTWQEILVISDNLLGSGKGTFQICEAGFDATTDPNIGINFTDVTPSIAGSALNVVLPLELIDFTAKPQKDNIALNWQTANEINFSRFELQRGTDAQNFETIAEIKGKGAGDYSYADATVTSGQIYYYRLKLIDNDASFKYSLVQSAVIKKADNLSVKFFPNPTSDVINVEINSDKTSNIRVFDMLGREIFSQTNVSQKMQINLSDFSEGVYFVEINSGNNSMREKIVKN